MLTILPWAKSQKFYIEFFVDMFTLFLQRNQKGVVIQVDDRDAGTQKTSGLVVSSERERED